MYRPPPLFRARHMHMHSNDQAVCKGGPANDEGQHAGSRMCCRDSVTAPVAPACACSHLLLASML